MRFSVRFVATISQGFQTCLKLVATLARQKLYRIAATKIASVNGPKVPKPHCTELNASQMPGDCPEGGGMGGFGLSIDISH